jgi:benzoyl-CoA-dihydrodiol lyase
VRADRARDWKLIDEHAEAAAFGALLDKEIAALRGQSVRRARSRASS